MKKDSKIIRNRLSLLVIAICTLFFIAEAQAQIINHGSQTVTSYENPYLGVTSTRTNTTPIYSEINVPVYQAPQPTQVVYVQQPVKRVVYQDVDAPCRKLKRNCGCNGNDANHTSEFYQAHVYELDPNSDSIVDHWRSVSDFKYVLTADKSKLTYYERSKHNNWKKVTENEVLRWTEDETAYILEMDSGQNVYFWKNGDIVVVEGAYQTILMSKYP